MQTLKSVVLNILRILSPLEIEKLTLEARKLNEELKMAAGAESVPIPSTSKHQSEQKEEEPEKENILPFKGKANASTEPEPTSQPLYTLENIGILPAQKAREEEGGRRQEELDQVPTMTEFILEERGKYRHTDEVLYQNSGMAFYRQSNNLKIFTVTFLDKMGKERRKVVMTKGVLVDKKQA